MRRTPISTESRASSVPPFALAGGFDVLLAPFQAPITIRSAAPGEVVLATQLSPELSGTRARAADERRSMAHAVPVHWEVAREPSFRTRERYGLLIAQQGSGFEVRIALQGLERGRSYWARLWAGGAWSRAVRVRTGPPANGSSALAVSLARRSPPSAARASAGRLRKRAS